MCCFRSSCTKAIIQQFFSGKPLFHKPENITFRSSGYYVFRKRACLNICQFARKIHATDFSISNVTSTGFSQVNLELNFSKQVCFFGISGFFCLLLHCRVIFQDSGRSLWDVPTLILFCDLFLHYQGPEDQTTELLIRVGKAILTWGHIFWM